jgi:endonuclease-8
MPEGDTIFRAARAMHRVLVGSTVTGFDTAYAKLASVSDNTPVTGRIIEKVEARGKWLLISFSGDMILLTHMLMSGSWHLYRTNERWQKSRSSMRMVISTNDWQAVGFNIPIAEFHTSRTLARHAGVATLGPDLLAKEFRANQGAAVVTAYAQTHPDAEIGDVLLNQRVLAGLGNVYKSEVCFMAAVNPFRKIHAITPEEITLITEIAHRYISQNVKEGAEEGIVPYTGMRRTTHSSDHGARLWVYRRQGEECRRCGTTLLSRKQGVGARTTFWCPQCQPLKTATR